MLLHAISSLTPLFALVQATIGPDGCIDPPEIPFLLLFLVGSGFAMFVVRYHRR